MTPRSVPLGTVLPIVLATSLSACGGGTTTVQGECQSVFGADVCTWATIADNRVVEFGATVPLASVEGAPAEAEMEFPPKAVAIPALPEQVRALTGFDHLQVNWEAHGHPPGLFLTPHFDFHFYTVDDGQVQAIDCSDLDKPTEVPAGYTLPDIEIPDMGTLTGLCVPKMGMHSMLQSEIDQATPFGASMIVGYYRKKVVFLEPMIAKAKLMDAKSFPMDIPVVSDPGPNVRWPTRFEAVYDAESRSYRFVFSGLPEE